MLKVEDRLRSCSVPGSPSFGYRALGMNLSKQWEQRRWGGGRRRQSPGGGQGRCGLPEGLAPRESESETVTGHLTSL